MNPNITKGADMGHLLRYLAGKGKHNEHRDQRVIAGDVVSMSVFAGRLDVARATELAKLLDSPRVTLLKGAPVLVTSYKQARALIEQGWDKKAAYAEATKDEHVWHCSLAIKATEGELSDEKWTAIAHDFLTEMGYIGRDDVPDVRWAAVRHGLSANGNDHIHLALSVVRPDGSLIDTYRDRNRAQAATNVVEHKHGLEVLASREEQIGTERGTQPGEQARAKRLEEPATDRERLRRTVRALVTATTSEAEWVRAMKDEGLLVRPRFAEGGQDEVTGYSVKLPSRVALSEKTNGTETVKSLWYGGGKLSKDLTLTTIRGWAGWDQSEDARQAAVEEWRRWQRPRAGQAMGPNAMSEKDTIAMLGHWTSYMQTIPATDRDAWAKAASQSSGLFAAMSEATERRPGPLDRLSRQLARAGDLPAHRRRPQPVHGAAMRSAARMLWSMQSPAAANLSMMYALMDCLLAVREMLKETDRLRASMAMASEARKALTHVHMRAAGMDPEQPYLRDEGTTAWASAMRASIVVDRLDPTETEAEIRLKAQAWKARYAADISRPGSVDYDRNGQIMRADDPLMRSRQNPEKKRSRSRTADLPTTPGAETDQSADYGKGTYPTMPPPNHGQGPERGRGR